MDTRSFDVNDVQGLIENIVKQDQAECGFSVVYADLEEYISEIKAHSENINFDQFLNDLNIPLTSFCNYELVQLFDLKNGPHLLFMALRKCKPAFNLVQMIENKLNYQSIADPIELHHMTKAPNTPLESHLAQSMLSKSAPPLSALNGGHTGSLEQSDPSNHSRHTSTSSLPSNSQDDMMCADTSSSNKHEPLVAGGNFVAHIQLPSCTSASVSGDSINSCYEYAPDIIQEQ